MNDKLNFIFENYRHKKEPKIQPETEEEELKEESNDAIPKLFWHPNRGLI